jgi:hypothetical protein
MKRLSIGLLFAALLFASTSLNANASTELLDLTPPTSSEIAVTSLMGEYDFDLYNRTNGWVLNGFYTKENGKWSKNWLTSKLQPGKVFRMMWSSASDEGACVVPFKVTWDDYDQAEDYSLDWCKGIKAVYLKDTTFTVDYK